MVHVTPDVVVRADALTAAPSTSGTVAPPADDQHPRSPSPQIDQFPSPPSSPPKLTIAQVRQPLPPVQTFLRPPVVSRQLETKLPVLRARQPAMVVRAPARPFSPVRRPPPPRVTTGRSPYLKPGRFLPPPPRFRLPPPAMPDPPFQVPKLKFRPLQFVTSETTRPRTPSPPRFRSSSPSTSPVASDDSSPNFRSTCAVPPQGRRPLTRACKSPSTQVAKELPQDAQRLSSTDESSTSDDDDWQSTTSLPRHVTSLPPSVPPTPPRMPWSWRTARLDPGAIFRTPPLSQLPMASRSLVLLPRARRQPLRSITPPLSPTSESTYRRRWMETIQMRHALDPFSQPRVAAVPIDLLASDIQQHLIRSAEHSELTAEFSVPGAAAQRRASSRPRRSCVNSPVQEPSSGDSIEQPSSPDDNLTSGYDSPNLHRRLQRRS